MQPTKHFIPIGALALGLALLSGACGDDDDSSDARSVSFASPSDGDVVTSPVSVVMAADGVTIEPAGEVNDGAGHFHVMVDEDCVDAGETIPGDSDAHLHFGKAQTETEIELEPGEHTLCLQIGDGEHTATELTDTITITVEES